MKFVKMGGKKKNIGRRAFVGIEPGLEEARKQKLLGDKLETHQNRIIAEQIYEKLIAAMKKQSPLFASLYVKKFGGGSSYEGLKVGKGNEFDIDVLLKIPKITKPVLKEDTIPGFVQLQLENFENLKVESPALYSEMKHFVDDQNYLLTMDMKSAFVQSIFDKTLQNYFPDKTVKIGRREYKILKIQTLGPAFTLSVEGQDFCGSIDLVPCILLTKDYWPKVGFKSNPYASPSEFFIVPKQPKRTHPHLNRYWRLSFQMQERVIIFNRLWMKPTIRIMKRIRDHFNQHTSSYALKTIFMWELYQQNPALDACIPDLWKHCLSYCVVYMLEKYLKCLEDRTVPYFWNSKLNLLDNLTDQQIDHYKGDIERMIKDVKANPLTEVILKYLEMADDKKKYNYMEDTLKDINAKFISLPDGDIKRNNQILQSILTTFIEKMKEKNPLFKAMFFRVFYGGSYYDGLRVGKPEEFDLDLLMRLPKYAEPVLTPANIPGFVHLQLKNYDAFMKQPEATPAYRNFHKLLDEKHFLDTSKVLNWMEGVVQQAMNDLPQGSSNGKRILSNSHGRFEIIVCKGGPALTLKLEGSGVKIDVDFVACFEFAKDKWPVSPFKPNPVASKPFFFIVPKKPKTAQSQPARYWRLSFQEQERVLIDDKRTLKPTVKLLKKMRDTLQHKCIASYYIKTVLLHIADKKGEEFWKSTQSYVFMTVLKEYREFIERGKIPYYWNTNNNLIGAVDKKTLENINNRLKVIINDIEKNSNDPKIIAKYLLNSHEYNIFMMGKLKM